VPCRRQATDIMKSLFRLLLRDVNFWCIQALVAVFALVPLAIEYSNPLGWTAIQLLSLSMVFISLLQIPVIYAGLRYGPFGAIAITVWSSALALPHILITDERIWQSPVELFAGLGQLTMFVSISLVLAQRIKRENVAGAKFRSLFESSPAAVLALSPAGQVIESNPAAENLFGMNDRELQGRELGDLVGREEALSLLSLTTEGTSSFSQRLSIRRPGGSIVYVQPIVSRSPSGSSNSVQIVLEDVSVEVQRQADLREYAGKVVAATEEERRRLARELHDDVVQRMAVLRLHLDALRPGASLAGPSATASLQEATALADGVSRTLRGYARSLRPQALDELGLVPSLKQAVVDLSKRNSIKWELDVSGEESDLSAEEELAVYRIVQEALRNAEIHSGATNVKVDARFVPDSLEVTIADNGAGFVLPSGTRRFSPANQMGLLGMHERAESIGAILEVASVPGKGTRVSLKVSLNHSRKS